MKRIAIAALLAAQRARSRNVPRQAGTHRRRIPGGGGTDIVARLLRQAHRNLEPAR